MNAIINYGLLLSKIREHGCNGFSDAAALAKTSPANFKKLSRGQIPRLDALQRICRTFGISEAQLIGQVKPRPEEPGEVVELKKSI